MNKFNLDINSKNYYGLALEVVDQYSEERLKKYQDQRIERGFDDTEWYSLDHSILRFVLPRLKAFKECKSYPYEIKSHDEWLSIIDSMIREIEAYIEGEDGADLSLFFKYFTHLWS